MNIHDSSQATLLTRLAWLAAFLGATLILTLGLGCEVPLIAFAALCGLRLARRHALLFVAAVWLTDELVGFTAWHYPMTAAGFGWAAAVGVGILAATWAAGLAGRRTAGVTRFIAAFFSAFAVYEALLWVVDMAAGVRIREAFGPAVLGQVLAINGATFAGLLLVRALKPHSSRPATAVEPGSQHA